MDLGDFARVRNVVVWSKGADLFKTTVIYRVTITVIANLIFRAFSRIYFLFSLEGILLSATKKLSASDRCSRRKMLAEEKQTQKPNKCNENTGKNCSRSDQ